MLLPFLLLAEDAASMLDRARVLTTAERPCEASPDSTDITVCGLRQADRFRVPLKVETVDRRDDQRAARAELVHRQTPIESLGPFLVGGGSAGVSVTTTFGGGSGSGETRVTGARPPAP